MVLGQLGAPLQHISIEGMDFWKYHFRMALSMIKRKVTRKGIVHLYLMTQDN